MYDIIIVGAGPAGITAGIYAQRAGFKTLVLEREFAGGQINTVADIDNYPGVSHANGYVLAQNMKAQAEELGVEFKTGDATHISEGHVDDFETRAVIFATGTRRRKLDVPGEKELAGAGVSYCATCDGGFFKGRDVCVVGGGNVALEDADYLAGICSKVYLIHRRDGFRAFEAQVEELSRRKNVEFVLNSTLSSIDGNQVVESVTLNSGRRISLAGCFIAVGAIPNTEPVSTLVRLEGGYVPAGEDGKTELPWLFVAGDVRKKNMYQIVTAVSDGANAAHSAGRYIRGGK